MSDDIKQIGAALSVKEVSEQMRVSIATVHRMIREENGIPHVRFRSRIIVYQNKLNEWINERMFNKIEADQNG